MRSGSAACPAGLAVASHQVRRLISIVQGSIMQVLIQSATTARWLPESIDVTIVLTTAGAGGTFGSVYGLGRGYTSAQIGVASGRATAAGLLLGVIGFLLAILLLPSSDANPPEIAAVLGFLGLSRRAALWLAPGVVMTVAGVVIVDGGARAWVAYALAAAGAVATLVAWEWSEPSGKDDADPRHGIV